MKLKACWILMAVIFLGAPHFSGAAPVLEETGYIFGLGGETYSFVADQTPLVYELTLTDFEFPAAFDFLGVAVTTSTDMVASLMAPGVMTFNVVLGTTYFANVLGDASGPMEVGLYGINIKAVPIPATLMLLGSGLFAVVALKKRNGRD